MYFLKNLKIGGLYVIQSNLQTAQEIATQMGKASDSIQSAMNKPLSTDDQTTLTVNEQCQEANQQALKLTNLFNKAFQKTIQNIHSAAEEFERKDYEIQIEINQSLNITNYIDDMNTYQKAKDG